MILFLLQQFSIHSRVKRPNKSYKLLPFGEYSSAFTTKTLCDYINRWNVEKVAIEFDERIEIDVNRNIQTV